jgi:hypothetical protein
LVHSSGRDEKKLVGEECKTRSAELWPDQKLPALIYRRVARHLSATECVTQTEFCRLFSPFHLDHGRPNLKLNFRQTTAFCPFGCTQKISSNFIVLNSIVR